MQLNNVFVEWLRTRKVSQKVIEDFCLRTEGDKLVIPVNLPDGTFSFNKYRRSPLSESGPKYTYDKGGKLALYGADKILDASEVLICEGEMDALVAWSCNIPAVSGTGGAMSFNADWANLFAGKTIYMCFDNDSAGAEGMVRALVHVPNAHVFFIPDKPGVKDISDYVAHGGNLNELKKTARTYSSLEEVAEDKSERISKWQSTHFHDAYIKYHSKPIRTASARPPRDPQMGDKVSRAKNYPITDLVSIGMNGNIRCLWHSEKESSLHYYSKENRTYCFGGCGRGYDAIDFYMKINNCAFKQAVEALQ